MMEISGFLKYLEDVKRYSPHTLLAYEKDILQFSAYCKEKELVDDWISVTPKMVRRWEVGLISGADGAAALSPKSVRRKLSSVSALYRYMMHNGEVSDNPVSGVALPNMKKNLPVFVDPCQMDELLDSDTLRGGFPEMRDRLILLTAYITGMRRSELVALKTEDVDCRTGNIIVNGKGSKQRIVPMTPELMSEMREYLEERNGMPGVDHNTLFVTDKGRPVYEKFIYRLVVRYLGTVTSLSKRSPHVLRHTFATALLNNGACIEAIRKLLGHTDLSATQVYTHTSIEGLKKIYNQAHPRRSTADEDDS